MTSTLLRSQEKGERGPMQRLRNHALILFSAASLLFFASCEERNQPNVPEVAKSTQAVEVEQAILLLTRNQYLGSWEWSIVWRDVIMAWGYGTRVSAQGLALLIANGTSIGEVRVLGVLRNGATVLIQIGRAGVVALGTPILSTVVIVGACVVVAAGVTFVIDYLMNGNFITDLDPAVLEQVFSFGPDPNAQPIGIVTVACGAQDLEAACRASSIRNVISGATNGWGVDYTCGEVWGGNFQNTPRALERCESQVLLCVGATAAGCLDWVPPPPPDPNNPLQPMTPTATNV
jgi:hypothetical protein